MPPLTANDAVIGSLKRIAALKADLRREHRRFLDLVAVRDALLEDEFARIDREELPPHRREQPRG